MNTVEKFLHYIDLKYELENFDDIHTEIEKGVVFKGTNLWILVFAILVATVGLNTNSTAVIIGAMLISPLMGPINGMGYSIATYNFVLLRKAIKNFSFAILASLFASTFYFALSPVSTAHSELLARTSPTIYDVMIALFGGLAGIVAISTKMKGNVIPGVAIATALMPPLCTAGYGLATAQFSFFFGAFYLFTINTVFIAFASLIVSQILKMPIRANVSSAQKKRINSYITAIITLTLIPSVYFGYLLVQRENFSENAARFAKNVTFYEGSFLLKSETDPGNKSLKLVYGGGNLNDQSIAGILEKAKDFNLDDSKITISQGFSVSGNENTEIDLLKTQISDLTSQLTKKQLFTDSLSKRPLIGKDLLAEISALYPQVTGCSFADTYEFRTGDGSQYSITLIVLSYHEKEPEEKDKTALYNWLSARLKTQKIKVLYEKYD